jgi:hypothetical protein
LINLPKAKIEELVAKFKEENPNLEIISWELDIFRHGEVELWVTYLNLDSIYNDHHQKLIFSVAG